MSYSGNIVPANPRLSRRPPGLLFHEIEMWLLSERVRPGRGAVSQLRRSGESSWRYRSRLPPVPVLQSEATCAGKPCLQLLRAAPSTRLHRLSWGGLETYGWGHVTLLQASTQRRVSYGSNFFWQREERAIRSVEHPGLVGPVGL